jgi:hypothetical protein
MVPLMAPFGKEHRRSLDASAEEPIRGAPATKSTAARGGCSERAAGVSSRTMIRLRFVQEYRGRRIVANGKLYGIQGELVTDCRYLNVAGARAAIDSETNAAAHRAHLESQRRHFSEFLARDGEKYAFACECGWRGPYNQLAKEGREVVVVRCPKCSSDDIYLAFDDATVER